MRLLHEDHVRDVLDDGIEEAIRALLFLLRPHAARVFAPQACERNEDDRDGDPGPPELHRPRECGAPIGLRLPIGEQPPFLGHHFVDEVGNRRHLRASRPGERVFAGGVGPGRPLGSDRGGDVGEAAREQRVEAIEATDLGSVVGGERAGPADVGFDV